MNIDEGVIRHLEALARLELEPEEREQLTEQLDRIVGYVRQLQQVDTDNVPPTSAIVHEDRAALRPDEVKPGLKRDAILAEAPDAAGRYFRVPRIIEKSPDATE